MGLYRLWHDVLGSAGGTHISPRLWLRLLRTHPLKLFPFLWTQIVRGRLFNAVMRQRLGPDVFLPKQIIIEPTLDCNLSCPECYSKRSASSMSAAMAEKLLSQGKALGINRYELMGGEPTMAASLWRGIIAGHRGCYFTFCTNGTLIDDAFLEGFKGMKNVAFTVSLDGPREITDRYRGKGTFDRAIAALRLIMARKMSAAVSITTRPEAWEEQLSDGFIGQLVDEGVFVIYTHFMVAAGKAELPPVDRVQLMLRLQALVKRFPIFLNEGYYGKMTPGGIVPRENHQVIVDPEGRIRPDRFDSGLDFGSLAEKDLLEILSDPALVEYKRRSKVAANDYLAGQKEELAARGFRVFQPRALF